MVQLISTQVHRSFGEQLKGYATGQILVKTKLQFDFTCYQCDAGLRQQQQDKEPYLYALSVSLTVFEGMIFFTFLMFNSKDIDQEVETYLHLPSAPWGCSHQCVQM